MIAMSANGTPACSAVAARSCLRPADAVLASANTVRPAAPFPASAPLRPGSACSSAFSDSPAVVRLSTRLAPRQASASLAAAVTPAGAGAAGS